MGYCPHVSNMFGPWHRPYLALFEQILHDRAVEVAKEYPAGDSRDRAMATADKVRLPYWDWAMNPPNSEEGCMPSSLRRPMATVTFPNGTTGNIANPLYRYDFHPLNYDDFAPLVCMRVALHRSVEADLFTERISVQELEPHHSLPGRWFRHQCHQPQ